MDFLSGVHVIIKQNIIKTVMAVLRTARGRITISEKRRRGWVFTVSGAFFAEKMRGLVP